MFGYVKPDNPYLYMKDDTLYRALYCGVCKSIGKNCGQRARFGLTYDIACFSALVHNLAGEDVEIKKSRCIAHAVVPRPMAKRDRLTDICAHINVALAYYKIKDDIADGDGGRVKILFFRKGKKRTDKKYPEISRIIEDRYGRLSALEKEKCPSVDMVSEPFSDMMVELSRFALGDKKTVSTDKLFYFLGKWIYLIDALDDYEKDVKGKKYNPLYYSYGELSTVKELLEKHGKDLSFAFSDIFAGLKQAIGGCEFAFNHDLIDNIMIRGIPATTLKILKNGVKDER